MTIKSKRSTLRVFDWPDAHAELTAGVDLDAFHHRLSRWWAEQAQQWWSEPEDPEDHDRAPERLEQAREAEEDCARAGNVEAYPE